MEYARDVGTGSAQWTEDLAIHAVVVRKVLGTRHLVDDRSSGQERECDP
jgi:hypothetical protein